MSQRMSATYNYGVLVILLILSLVTAVIWYRKKNLADAEALKLRLVRISKSEFDSVLEDRKFSCMYSWVATPATRNFFKGIINGFNTYLFSIAATKTTSNLSVLLKSEFTQLPNFKIKPKSFTEEVGDMLGIRNHYPAYPAELIDKYDITSDDDNKLSPILTPEIIGCFLKNEDVWVEVQRGDLMVLTTLIDDAENFKEAIEMAHTLAHLFGRGRPEEISL